MVTKRDVINHIKKCNKSGKRYNWLGFVENVELTRSVEELFIVSPGWYDWVNGNNLLSKLELRYSEKDS